MTSLPKNNNATESEMHNFRRALVSDGFLVFENYVPSELLNRSYILCNKILEKESNEERQKIISLGSIGKVKSEPELLELGLYPEVLSFFDALVGPLVYHLGVVFSKPANSPPTFWHQDCIAWSESITHAEMPHHIQLIWYFNETSINSGCLRLIPGSHRVRHKLHDFWDIENAEELERVTLSLRAAQLRDSAAFKDFPDEVAVPVKFGDLVVIDTRIFHGAYANSSTKERTALMFSYFSNIDRFSSGFRYYLSSYSQKANQFWPKSFRDQFANRLLISHEVDRQVDYYPDKRPRVVTFKETRGFV